MATVYKIIRGVLDENGQYTRTSMMMSGDLEVEYRPGERITGKDIYGHPTFLYAFRDLRSLTEFIELNAPLMPLEYSIEVWRAKAGVSRRKPLIAAGLHLGEFWKMVHSRMRKDLQFSAPEGTVWCTWISLEKLIGFNPHRSARGY
jgi:hypothetical protein